MENEIVHNSDEFYISYLHEPSELAQAMDGFVAAAMGNDTPPVKPETALCVRDDKRTFGVVFYILYGDHRAAYKAIAEQGLDTCMQYFLRNIEHMGHSSDRPPTTIQ